MQVDSKFLWLSQPTKIGADIDGWRVCWLGGWDKHRVFFTVMVDKPKRAQKTETSRKIWRAVARALTRSELLGNTPIRS